MNAKKLKTLLFERNEEGVYDVEVLKKLEDFLEDAKETTDDKISLSEVKKSELMFYSELLHNKYTREKLKAIQSNTGVVKVIVLIYFVISLIVAFFLLLGLR
ncbi:hypothetical protein KDU71_07740 [Carboxylicivirga sediminis]|uniref:Uncharacterized protein n=1 Tax=Carboxylicivirga sediminis TaxID=2006564 RepID=A0A941F2Z9_9BACT|nr:hypothetical protein [Carboxylicivirga sediminis]MBR8535447.1 hypothetical protein [Carboxylicivirga sediminis]